MAVKELAFEIEARKGLLTGVEKLASAVKATLGPRGRNAIIDKSWGGPTVTKDGVTVAEEVELSDKTENMGAKLVKEAASKTNDACGDGTTSSSGFGVIITATEQGSSSASSDSTNVIIGGTAASITITASTKVASGGDDTFYTLPMSVLVTDSSGAAVENAVISLSVWPTRYATGSSLTKELIVPNEDANRNLVLDVGEDVGPCTTSPGCTALTFGPDGKLTPPSSAGGSVPSTITSEANGVASFQLTYLKNSAVWIETEITATVRVMGTESTTTYTEWLGYLINDADSLPPSPYGYL